MPWTETEVEDGQRWERSDGYAYVTVRKTAAGDWMVALDRLQQAADGARYEHATVETENKALDLAAEWRNRFDLSDN